MDHFNLPNPEHGLLLHHSCSERRDCDPHTDVLISRHPPAGSPCWYWATFHPLERELAGSVWEEGIYRKWGLALPFLERELLRICATLSQFHSVSSAGKTGQTPPVMHIQLTHRQQHFGTSCLVTLHVITLHAWLWWWDNLEGTEWRVSWVPLAATRGIELIWIFVTLELIEFVQNEEIPAEQEREIFFASTEVRPSLSYKRFL